MKKLSTKLLSLAIVTAIIFAFSIVPTLASVEPTTWDASWDTTGGAVKTIDTITATNISESGVTVRAYQIVKGTYKDGKLTGYVLCDEEHAPVDNIEAPTSSEITAIANYIQGHPSALTYIVMQETSAGSGTYTADVEAGEYVILVSDSNAIVYNPAVVAVNVTNANLIAATTDTEGGSVDMESQFDAGDTAYMKSSTTGFRKQIEVDNTGNTPTYSHVDTVSFRDTVKFVLDNMTIPSYSADYGNPDPDPENNVPVEYIINDDLNPDNLAATPFSGVNSLTVKVGGATVSPAADTFTVTYYDEAGDPTNDTTDAVSYKIEFADAFLRAHGTDSVEVTYVTTVTDNAQLALSDYSHDFISNNTSATLEYSNNPTSDAVKTLSDSTKTYTFGIDSGNSIKTYELNKITDAALNQQDPTYSSVTSGDVTTMKHQNALQGATFTIYSDSTMQTPIAAAGKATAPPNGTSISDANGHIEFVGLKAGTYYLKETTAPNGKSLNNNNYTIVISETYNAANTALATYTITTYLGTSATPSAQVGIATYSVSNGTVSLVNDNPNDFIPVEIVNTTLATLPITGGMGTIIISVIAGLGMAIFLTVFIVSKKKSSKKN